MLLLLAQLVAPPLQDGPIRLPGPSRQFERPVPSEPLPPAPVDIRPLETPVSEPDGTRPPPPTPAPGTQQPAGPLPEIRGLTLYSPLQVREILAECSRIADPLERLKACAVALSTRLVFDGYVSSRVYVVGEPAPGYLDVVEGRVVGIQVSGGDPRLNRRVERLLRPLRGQILRLSTVEQQLQLLKRQPGIESVRGTLARLGSDPSEGVFRVAVEPAREPWQGDLALRNDGTSGSGEFRAVATLLKPSLLRRGDTLLIYGELDATDTPELGAAIASVSYTYPFSDTFSLTGGFGFSRRNLVELPSPVDGFSTSQFQALAQFEWVFRESLSQRWSLFAGYSNSRSTTYEQDTALPAGVPESVRSPAGGYLRFGVNGSGTGRHLGWNGSAYLLQGVTAATPAIQRQQLAEAGIAIGGATAIGGFLSGSWTVTPRWQINLRTAAQLAFAPLTSSMQFTLGSDVGLRGLPGQLISGDSGWLASTEAVWTFWNGKTSALQLVPFMGAGGIRTNFNGGSFGDTVGAGGVLLRWLANNNWTVELGWAKPFSTTDNLGVWNDWLLGQGLYTKVNVRF
ncbi:ShlB/FhaC/HecB family hemolysin secretion/activation protein [Synechococcus sp. CS-1332]|uniref:ShlB/FhaC/HecB family hemolysin secretion/activation protein n=1 Tax=Synechococcus sp. CS-1332 TaxID=2847972 RepID=UPI00223B660E|nr:ShlB/FhaC/HecB family hemolysin secretion/activation protein [Synechococcus sp. CS-1332]MCT0208740.1 ShlB/FhaC/HecB family hemolysin secretion/activation protein [Synechococcus sp. CS-1332]